MADSILFIGLAKPFSTSNDAKLAVYVAPISIAQNANDDKKTRPAADTGLIKRNCCENAKVVKYR